MLTATPCGLDQAERDCRWKFTASAHPFSSCSQAWVSLLALMFTQSLANKEQLIGTCTDMYPYREEEVQALDQRFLKREREIFESCSTNQFVYNSPLLPNEHYELGSPWASWFITPLDCLLCVFIILSLGSPNAWNNSAFWVGFFFFSLSVKLSVSAMKTVLMLKYPLDCQCPAFIWRKVEGRVLCV